MKVKTTYGLDYAEFHPNCGWDKKETGIEDSFEKAFRKMENMFGRIIPDQKWWY